MVRMSLDIRNPDAFIVGFKGNIKKAKKVVNKLIRKEASRVRKDVFNEIHSSYGIPRNSRLRQVRGHKKVEKGYASLWFGLNAISSGYLGRVFKSGSGGFAGKFYQDNSFVFEAESGFKGLGMFGDSGFEIVEFELPDYENIIIENNQLMRDRLENDIYIGLSAIEGFK